MLHILLYGVLVHFVFLASVFVIYFQSPVIQGLRPHPDLAGAPAKRLVLFVADGLRAESFYRDGCGRTPFLRDVLLQDGMHGVSHTRIPTESRPGHVALIAGLYEDPSAVLRGWQRNPVDFDSLFNRSAVTHAWGSPDILSVFSMDMSTGGHRHIRMHSYDPADEDFSGRTSTVILDEWVFDRFAAHLRAERASGTLLASHPERTVLFLHLLGLDTAGHVHKPNSRLFDENLAAVDRGVAHSVRLVEEMFDHDGRTAFVFTADHGMTDAGAHGAGAAHETETPFVAWGAGFANWRQMPNDGRPMPERAQRIGATDVPRFDIEQADAAPLMAAVLGVAVPMNNFGTLPVQYLNASMAYVARAMYANALQMGTQFEHLRKAHGRGWLAGCLGDFAQLDGEMVAATERRIRTALANGKWQLATELSAAYLRNARLGIEYYQQYYQYALLAAVCLSMTGWLVFLVQKVTKTANISSDIVIFSGPVYAGIVGILVLTVTAFVYLQGIPLHVGVFFVLPIVCWLPCNAVRAVRLLLDMRTWLFLLASDVLVWTFFHRGVLAVLMAVLPVLYVLTSFKGNRRALLKRNAVWLISSGLLGAFTLLPAVGRTATQHQYTVLLIGLAAWPIKLGWDTFAGADGDCRHRIEPVRALNLLLCLAAVFLVLYRANGFDRMHGLSAGAQAAAWLIAAAAAVLPLLQPRSDRLQRIADSLCQPYVLMSLSYEPLFLLVLALNLGSWVQMEQRERPNGGGGGRVDGMTLRGDDVRRAYVVLAYVLLSFFGTGNLASISSFDPNAVRCFVGTFSPFVMAGLIVVKLFVPVLLVMCASTAINVAGGRPTESLIIVVLIICDIMCAHFLFFVRNKGSWLDIGVSISHFVIMESTVLVLCILEWLSRRLLDVQLIDVTAGPPSVGAQHKVK